MARSNPPDDGLATTMGVALRARRTEMRLSLSETARRASVSTSYLSAVENGTSVASLPVLSRIAHALEASIGELLAGQTASTVRLGHLDETPGTSNLSSPALQMKIAAHTSDAEESGQCPFPIERASVVVYVRRGTLEVTVDGEHWRLDEGDALHAQEPAELTWRVSEPPTTAIWTVAPSAVT